MKILSVEDGSLQKAIEERARAETEYLKKHPDYTVIPYTPTEGGFNNLKERIEELEKENLILKDRLERAKKISNEWTVTKGYGVDVWVSIEKLNAMWNILNKE